jgi:cytochrome o ubiquinol oxidase subunit 2
MIKKTLDYLKWVIILTAITSLTACHGNAEGILNPKGIIALHERKLFFDTLALMLIVVLPVIVMSFTFAYHYQVSHRVRDYKPNWGHNHFLESLWWGIPCVIIVILAVLTWKKTHELDPYRAIVGQTQTTLHIQAIALPWKWLFIYPEQNIATVNYLEIPIGQSVEYSITADNVAMSALFIPQLGSQIYAMTGMRTRLNLLANTPGDYIGMNALFNGDGFSDMQFVVHAVTPDVMQNWIHQMQKSPQHLTNDLYEKLLVPSEKDAPMFFSHVTPHLFETILQVYMASTGPEHPRAKFQAKLTKE